MTTGITEILADGSTRKRSVILQCSRITSCSSHHNRVVQCSVLTKRINDRSNGRTLLTDSYIDTIYRVACQEVSALVDNRINRNGSLSRLAVADNQLTLSATDRNHGVYRLQSRLQRLVHRLTVDYSRSFPFQWHIIQFASNQSLAVERFAQRVDHTSQHALSYTDRSDTFGTFHDESLFDLVRRTQQHSTHVVLFEVHHDCFDTIVKLQQFIGFGISQSIDTHYAVAHLEHRTDFVKLHIGVDSFELLAQYIRYFAYFYIFRHYTILLFLSINCCFTRFNCVATLASSR